MLVIDLIRLLERHQELSGAYPESTKLALRELRSIFNDHPYASLPAIRKSLLGDERYAEVCREERDGVQEGSE
jgi:hypothetical protein